ncbi:MAG TPA: hypothetical protein VFN75_02150 [Pseudonocardiaceae bacterium]|nr:hypothetical protein [Pseudonocardiaceae bacterium]
MLNLDDRPAPPQLPEFSRDMKQFLLAAAHANASRRPTIASFRGRYAAAGLAAAAVVAAATVGIDYLGSGGSDPPAINRTGGPSTSGNGGVHIHLAAFSVDTNPDGTVTIQTTRDPVLDASALRQALAQAGVPALVTVGTACRTADPAKAASTALSRVISRPQTWDGHTVFTVTPAAIPAGEKLSIGYFAASTATTEGSQASEGVYVNLVSDNAAPICTPIVSGAAQ